MMSEKIGITAGKIWHYLKSNGETSYADLKKKVVGRKVSMPDTIVSSAIGWLAREGKLSINEHGRGKGYRLTLSLAGSGA